jgi:hypothetical protein
MRLLIWNSEQRRFIITKKIQRPFKSEQKLWQFSFYKGNIYLPSTSKKWCLIFAGKFPFYGLSATSQQHFSLRTNHPAATSQQYFSLSTNQHQPPAKRTGC